MRATGKHPTNGRTSLQMLLSSNTIDIDHKDFVHEDGHGNQDYGGGANDEDRPTYKYTEGNNVTTLKVRNQGWNREGMKRYALLYEEVKKDRQQNGHTFDSKFKQHMVDCCGGKNKKRKRGEGGGMVQQPVPDDLDMLMAAV